MLYVLTKQLQGKAEAMQINGDPHMGMALNLGGYSMVVAVVLSN